MRLLLVLWSLSSTPVLAAELLALDVTHEDGVYTMTSTTRFDAPLLGVFDVLTDYEHFDRISSVYRESGYLEAADDGTPRVFTTVRGCVMLFCQTMRRTERLENEGSGFIRATVEAGSSDFASSEATWHLTQQGESTVVVYAIRMQPSFWVPPVIGPYMMKRKLAQGGADAIERIEALALASTATVAELTERGLKGLGNP